VISVQELAALNEGRVIACYRRKRTSDLHPDAVEERCDLCGAPIVCHKKSQAQARGNPGWFLTCNEDFQRLIAARAAAGKETEFGGRITARKQDFSKEK
jgi:hypothetical protein